MRISSRIVVTPGRDFGTADRHNFIRFSTASSMPQLKVAIERLKIFLETMK